MPMRRAIRRRRCGISSLLRFRSIGRKTRPTPPKKEMRHFLYEQRPDLRDGLHAHTVQLILDDLMDAVSTYRSNRDSGDKNARAPHREKNYRPLEFTAGFGWRVTPDGRRIP